MQQTVLWVQKPQADLDREALVGCHHINKVVLLAETQVEDKGFGRLLEVQNGVAQGDRQKLEEGRRE